MTPALEAIGLCVTLVLIVCCLGLCISAFVGGWMRQNFEHFEHSHPFYRGFVVVSTGQLLAFCAASFGGLIATLLEKM